MRLFVSRESENAQANSGEREAEIFLFLALTLRFSLALSSRLCGCSTAPARRPVSLARASSMEQQQQQQKPACERASECASACACLGWACRAEPCARPNRADGRVASGLRALRDPARAKQLSGPRPALALSAHWSEMRPAEPSPMAYSQGAHTAPPIRIESFASNLASSLTRRQVFSAARLTLAPYPPCSSLTSLLARSLAS